MTKESLYLVDMGSTRCRVWLAENGQVLAYASADFGVRDVAGGTSVANLRQQLERLIADVGRSALDAGLATVPGFAIGAGMITSAQGLLEIPHVTAPASISDLANHMQACQIGDALTLFLVPGVKTISRKPGIDAALRSDVMRGEEALCFGLLATGLARAPGAVLNLGSHWKWIFLDSEARIAASRTSLTGEIIHAAQSQTLLASGLPQARPAALDPVWLTLGSREFRRSGLTRALFGIRLLEEAEQGTPAQRLAFLYGIFLESDLNAFRNNSATHELRDVSIVGPPALAAAWQSRLVESQLHVSVVSEEQRDAAFLRGLTAIFDAARQRGKLPSIP